MYKLDLVFRDKDSYSDEILPYSGELATTLEVFYTKQFCEFYLYELTGQFELHEWMSCVKHVLDIVDGNYSTSTLASAMSSMYGDGSEFSSKERKYIMVEGDMISISGLPQTFVDMLLWSAIVYCDTRIMLGDDLSVWKPKRNILKGEFTRYIKGSEWCHEENHPLLLWAENYAEDTFNLIKANKSAGDNGARGELAQVRELKKKIKDLEETIQLLSAEVEDANIKHLKDRARILILLIKELKDIKKFPWGTKVKWATIISAITGLRPKSSKNTLIDDHHYPEEIAENVRININKAFAELGLSIVIPGDFDN